MDWTRSWDDLHVNRWVSKRVQAVSTAFESRIRFIPQWSVGLCFLLFALGIGRLAHRSSGKGAVEEWEKANRPSRQLATAVLAQVGFRPVANTFQGPQGSQGPEGEEQKGVLWVGGGTGSEFHWAAWSLGREDVESIQLYCRDCAKTPGEWRRMGIGWQGLEALTQVLEGRPSGALRHSPQYRDPREITY